MQIKEVRNEEKTTKAYAFAKKSHFANLGEDVKNSARHRRNCHLDLALAEQEGTAEKKVFRDELLKSDPPKYLINKENYRLVLASHLCLKAMPAKPLYRRHSKAKEMRKNYVKVYFEIKKYAESVGHFSTDEVGVLENFRKRVRELIKELRQDDGYCEIANLLCDYLNHKLRRFGIKKNTVMGKIKRFNELTKNQGDAELFPKVQEIIYKGKGLDRVLGITQKRVQRAFERKSVYIGQLSSGANFVAKSQAAQEDYLLNTVKLRGLQWGNYVSDGERKKFLPSLCQAFFDLAEVLQLPIEMTSGQGELAVAVGARGRKDALAHFEFGEKVINLTKAKGFGSLAHEWAHFIDNALYRKINGAGKISRPFFSSFTKNPETLPNNDLRPILFDLNAYFNDFSKRLKTTDELYWGTRKVSYWLSPCELFARSFETYLADILQKKDKPSPFLVAIRGCSLWPNNDELETVSPIFNRLFSWIRENL